MTDRSVAGIIAGHRLHYDSHVAHLSPGDSNLSDWSTLYPFLTLVIGLAVVVVGIVIFRVNAFLALITAAMVVSFMAPGDWAVKSSRVAQSFGETAGGIGIVIALAAIIGKTMLDSGAADRVVRMFLSLLGEKRSGAAFSASSCTLAIPVFFDTVFYLMVPLVRSMFRQTGRHYLFYLVAVATGAITHAVVPPTPGPLLVASTLDVDLGLMILMGIVVAIPAGLAGLWFAGWIDRHMNLDKKALEQDWEQAAVPTEAQLPGLALSLTPIVLPTLLIAANTIATMWADSEPTTKVTRWIEITSLVGNPNFALLVSAAIAVWTYVRQCRPTKKQMTASIEEALMSAGVIILITAAGGAFGGMLKQAQLAPAIETLFGESAAGGITLLLLAFAMTSLLKIAQGSTTAAMIVTSGMFAAMIEPSALGYNPVYLALAIGSGGLVGSWMNDSGFWIFAKMGGLTELEALKSWTPLLAILGSVAMVTTLILSIVLPMALN
jgi:GntP family gluconate:H+ symporter